MKSFVLGCICTALVFGMSVHAQIGKKDRLIGNETKQTLLYTYDPEAVARHAVNAPGVPDGSFPAFAIEGWVKPIDLRNDIHAVYYYTSGGKMIGPFAVESCVGRNDNGCSEARPRELPSR